MPTNEERREVARRLRNFDLEVLPVILALEAYNKSLIMICTLALIVCGSDEVTGREMIDRLADLIEPELERTCHFRFDHLDANGSSWEACDNCHALFAGVDVNLDFAYCPACGAKVVPND